MSFLLRLLGLFLALALSGAVAACSSKAAAFEPRALPPADTSSLSISFDATGQPVTVALGAAHELEVTALPAGVYDVRFGLIDTSLDASLDASVATTDAAGHASVTLHAPSQAAMFGVRASILDAAGAAVATAEVSISAVDEGSGTVRVTPVYTPIGMRTVTEWTASLVAHAACADIDSTLPGNLPGALTATAAPGSPLVITGVPVGADLAVAVRAGHFAWGCADASPLTDGATASVTVDVANKLLDLSAADLALSFPFTPDPTNYAGILADGVATLAEAFVPASAGDGPTLLDAMAALVPASQSSAFAESRSTLGWDALATAYFAMPGQGLRDTCVAWATAGSAALPTTFEATATSGSAPQAILTVTGLAGLGPAASGATASTTSTWSAQPNDTVLLQGALYFEPSRLAGSASLAPALAAEPSAMTVSDALSLAAGCQGLASTLGPFGSCDVDCMTSLCEAAVSARWTAAVGASEKSAMLGEITFQASAAATIDDTATATGLMGQWLGDLTDPELDATLTGTLSATQAPPPSAM